MAGRTKSIRARRPEPTSSLGREVLFHAAVLESIGVPVHPTPDEPDYDSVEMLYIDPDECIDCDACVEACPVDACFAEDQLPAEWAKYAEINADYYKSKSAA